VDRVHVVNRLRRGVYRSNDIPRHRQCRRRCLDRHDVRRLLARGHRDRRWGERYQTCYLAGDGHNNWRPCGCQGRCGPLVRSGLCDEERLRVGGARRQRESRGALLQETLAICFPAKYTDRVDDGGDWADCWDDDGAPVEVCGPRGQDAAGGLRGRYLCDVESVGLWER
jgi:hypothetical protein